MRALKNLNAANDAITVKLPTDKLAVAGVQYPTGGTGTLVLEGTIDEVTWEQIALYPSDDMANPVASIAAAGHAQADVSGFHSVRLRKSASTGACIAGLVINHN